MAEIEVSFSIKKNLKEEIMLEPKTMDFIFFFFFLFYFILHFLDLRLEVSITSHMIVPSFLSLVPPSCMVVPVRDLGNKFSSTTSNTSSSSLFKLLTVSFSNYTEMDIFPGTAPDNYDEVRGRPLSTNTNISRDSSMSFARSSVAYHEKIERNNDMVIDNDFNDSSLALSYENEQERAIYVSKAADLQNNMRPQCDSLNVANSTSQHVLNEDHQSNTGNKVTQTTTSHKDEVINIQLPYSPQAPMEPEL